MVIVISIAIVCFSVLTGIELTNRHKQAIAKIDKGMTTIDIDVENDGML